MQKKYPFIKIDIQNITKQEKKNKKIKQIENMMIKPFNIIKFNPYLTLKPRDVVFLLKISIYLKLINSKCFIFFKQIFFKQQ